MTDTAVPGDSERHPGPNAWLLEEMRSQFEQEPERLDDDSLSFFATTPAAAAITPSFNHARCHRSCTCTYTYTNSGIPVARDRYTAGI